MLVHLSVISNDHAPLNGETDFLPRDKATEVIVEDEAATMAGRTDDGYKHRLLHTLCVCSTMFALVNFCLNHTQHYTFFAHTVINIHTLSVTCLN